MKMKSTLRMMLMYVCCAICSNGMMSATPTDVQVAQSKAVRTLTQMLTPNRQENNKNYATSVKALPAKILKYDWQSGAWSAPTTVMRFYTPEGWLSLESEVNAEGAVVREITYDYDIDGNISSMEESLWNENVQMLMSETRTRYKYDPVVTDFCVSEIYEIYGVGGWKEKKSESCKVTRNSAGNVAEILYSENGKESHKLCMEYGVDGKANKITSYEFVNGWKLAGVYYDMAWKETNGQLLIPYDEFGLFVHNGNLIEKCTIETYDAESGDEDEWMSKLTFAFEYTDNGSYTGTINGMLEDMNINGSSVSNMVLENGGMDMKIIVKANMGFFVDSLEMRLKTEYDAWHNCLTDIDYMMMDDYYDYEVYKKGEVTYSSQTGLPETYVVKELDYDSYDDEQPVTDADFVNLGKYEFQEYATSGITEVTSDRGDNDVLYDLSGRRIASPHAGQPYIKNGRKYIGK